MAPVGAGLPAKFATRYMAPALPVFAGKPAPTGYESAGLLSFSPSSSASGTSSIPGTTSPAPGCP
ncbi:hypothetical protein E5221_28905 [Pseudomonas sp. A2]|nr:hypothetical protein E5221_28905 [Pseudomonas sp. A2]